MSNILDIIRMVSPLSVEVDKDVLDTLINQFKVAEVFAEVRLEDMKMRDCPKEWLMIDYDPGIARIAWSRYLDTIGYNPENKTFDRYSECKGGGALCDLYKVARWSENGITIEVKAFIQ